MAKKVRRVRQKHAPTKNKENDAEAKVVLKTKLNAAEQFRQEYAYVRKDLRQVLILAVFMFALLIALNLFLQ